MRAIVVCLAIIAFFWWLALTGRAASTAVMRNELHQRQGTVRFFHNHLWIFNRMHYRTWQTATRQLYVARQRIAFLLPRVAPPLGHLRGWVCIHNREGAWNAQTGNGFFGGLQMTYGWAGRVGNAALLTPHDQIAAAEAEAAEHGWAYDWMHGQWPNTYPPCAGYF